MTKPLRANAEVYAKLADLNTKRWNNPSRSNASVSLFGAAVFNVKHAQASIL